MKNKKKIADFLGKHFGDDPDVSTRVYTKIDGYYAKQLAEMKKASREALAAAKAESKADFARRDKEAAAKHQASLSAIREARDTAIKVAEERVKKAEGGAAAADKSLREWLERMYGHRLDSHGKTIERLTSEIGMGAPNRSIYLNGAIISGRYSDVNLIAGAGISITESDNETTHMADVTFTSNGSGNFVVMVPTGTVDGSNKIYTWSTAPQVIVLDNGNIMNKVSSDGTVNWTGTTTTTLSQAPNSNIFGM